MFLKSGLLAIRVVVETAYNIPGDIMTNIFGEKFLDQTTNAGKLLFTV